MVKLIGSPKNQAKSIGYENTSWAMRIAIRRIIHYPSAACKLHEGAV
jgi:hypothetical protein